MVDVVIPEPLAVPVLIRPRRWPRLLIFALAVVGFWYLEYLYQYMVYEPGNFAGAWIRSHALAGTTLIALALLSSIVFKFFPRLAVHWRWRRRLGVAGVLIISLHVLGVLKYGYAYHLLAIFFSWNPYLNPVLFGVAAYPILLGMLFTSTDWAVRKLKRWWKFIHRFIYLAEVGIIFHALLLGGPSVLKSPAGYLLYAVASAAILGQVYWWIRVSQTRKFKNAGFYVGLAVIGLVLMLWYFLKNKGYLLLG